MRRNLAQGAGACTTRRPHQLHTAVPFSAAPLRLFQGQGTASVRALPSSHMQALPTDQRPPVIILPGSVSLLYSLFVLLVTRPLSLFLSSPDMYIGVRTYHYSIHRRNFLC